MRSPILSRVMWVYIFLSPLHSLSAYFKDYDFRLFYVTSIFSPGFKVTIAFFQSGVLPSTSLTRLFLPRTAVVFTFLTFTLYISSTALFISSLFAFFSTQKRYLLMGKRCVPFSVLKILMTIEY